jgi:hypothetical protein
MIDRLRKFCGTLAVAALALAGCAPQVERAPAAGKAPAMWQVSDEDTTITLFGTFHLLPQGQEWRTPAMESALAGADELVMELADTGDMNAMAGAMMTMGVSPNLPPIAERVPEEKRAELRRMIAESGMPEAVFDRLETWAAALSLAGVMFKRLGLSAQAGVETGLTAKVKASGKPIRGLETVEQQFGFFDTLPEEAQRAFLVGFLDDSTDMRAQFAAMLKAWSTGDVEGIAATFNDEMNMSPQLRDKLLKERNARWAEWLERRMASPGKSFVAVGAGHLAGRDSVQSMLKARGLKVKRVQ